MEEVLVFTAERQEAIVELVQTQERAGVRELAERFNVTPETIRRDLNALEQRKLIQRAHGGAVRVERLSFVAPVTDRGDLYGREKLSIAAQALSSVPENSSIAIDAGTTTVKLAELIPQERHLTVVTYSLIVASLLSSHPHIRLHMLGGKIHANSQAAVGPWAQQEIESITLDAVFLSVDGISAERGITTHNSAEATIKAALVRSSRKRVVLADHSKLGREEFSRICPVSDVDTIITSSGADPEIVHGLELRGPNVVVTHVDPHSTTHT